MAPIELPLHTADQSFTIAGVTTPRYDAIADWYVDFTRDWPREPYALFPDDVAGRRVLDMACGYGTGARHLAAIGARVTAVDLSSKLLAHAEAIEAEHRAGIRYLHGDVTTTEWWDGQKFDGVLCNMALMDIDDLDRALTTVATVLEPGGWFSASILHPCFPGGSVDDPAYGLSSWPPDRGYSWEGRWNTEGVGVRGHAGVNHRTLATYLNALLRAGFAFEAFAEDDSERVPRYLVVRGRAVASR
jgi:SAM-dependent methyltransferase